MVLASASFCPADDAGHPLPEPGGIAVYEPHWRRQRRRARRAAALSEEVEEPAGCDGDAPAPPLRLVQWNIERGYEMGKVLSILEELEADAVALQEVDIGCKRSGGVNQAKLFADSLGMTCAFVCEFRELEHQMRAERDQGGGVHGNAILTRYPAAFRAIDHLHHPYDWETDGHQIGEPRAGRRFTLVADIQPDDGIPAFQLYSAHLEIFCGLSGRVAQISDLLHDAATHAAPPPPLSTRANLVPRQALFGDLNTSAHGIARLSPRLCRDSFRWRTLGTAESLWVDECVFAFHVLQGEKNVYLEKYRLPELFPEIVLRHARNPGFVDPWHPTRDITLRSRSYMSLYQAKLDWTLLRGFDVVGQLMGNHDYSASDHKYLLVDVVPSRDDEPVNGGEAGAGEARGLGNGIGGNVSPTAAAKEVVRFQARRLEALRRRRRMLDVLDEEGGLLGTRAARVFVGAATAAVLVIGMWFLQRKRK